MKVHENMRASAIVVFAFFVLAACPFVYGQPLFEDVAPQLGIADNERCGQPFWYDYDNDGDLDLLRSARFSSDTYMYRNDGTVFTRLENIGLPQNWDVGLCIPMDFDHDGDLDIAMGNYGDPHLLLVNEGGTFINRTTQLGLPNMGGNRYLDWLDWNGDGWMDLLWQTSSGWRLFRNDNGTHFTNVASQAGLPSDDGAGFCLTDIDLDGDLDMFATRISSTGRFWLNNGNSVFVDATFAAGLNNIPASAGCAWADINNDKYPDLVTQDYGSHGIWLNLGNGTFQRMIVHGMETNFGTWPYGSAYAIADYDMDGKYDIFCALPGTCSEGTYCQLFHQDRIEGSEIWLTNVAPDYGMDHGSGGNPRWADYDGDGDLDLLLLPDGVPIQLWRNNLINNSNYLQVRVLGPNGEQDRWFSRVEVYPHGQSQVLRAAELSYSSVGCNGLKHYFVLDANSGYDLRIYFPSGDVMTPENYPQLSNVVPSQVGHLVTVQMGLSAAPVNPPVTAEFRMVAAYPNPFNPSTVIRYTIPADAQVRLSVYDVLGRHVAELVHESLPAGEHRVVWDASGSPSGIYLIHLRAGNSVAIQKAVLMK